MIGYDSKRKTYFVQVTTKDPLTNKKKCIKKPHKYAVFLLCGILVASNLTIFYIIPGILVHAHALLFASYADTHR